MDRNEAEELVATIPHWHHRFEIFPGVITPGAYDPAIMLDALNLPDSLRGKTVLDIGASDGFYARALHLRGARVTCIDYRAKDGHGFAVMEKLCGHTFDYRRMNVYDIDSETLGTFDIVLFLGVLYHLPDMIAGLRKVRSVCREALYLESEIDGDMNDAPVARYHPGNSFNNDLTNFWSPNPACVRAMLIDAGFSIDSDVVSPTRMLVRAKPITFELSEYKMKLAYGAIA